jgi:hypothetical protein
MRNVTNRIGLAVIAGCIAVGSVAIAGCGGGGSGALSESAFISQADAICKDLNDRVAALPAMTSTQATISTLTQENRMNKIALSKLAALQPPSNLQDDWSQSVSDSKATFPAAEELPSALKSGDTAKVRALWAEINAKGKASNALARKIGLTACAKSATPQG